MNYTLHLPPNYTPPPLPGRDEWVADLRANPDKQCAGKLGTPKGPNCCLGRLSLLQGHLTSEGDDMWGEAMNCQELCYRNPIRSFMDCAGMFPVHVNVKVHGDDYDKRKDCLSECNDAGLSFAQIADIIETVWSNGGPLLK